MAKEKIEKSREEKITTEYRRIAKALKSIPLAKQKVAQKLMEEAAYMTALIEDARSEIDKKGIIELYQNGENQMGRKKNPAVEVYDKTINSYAKIIKQLTDLMPDSEAAKEAGAILKAFIDSEN